MRRWRYPSPSTSRNCKGKIQKLLGANVIFIIRKFFGVILLAMAINMFVNNILEIIHQVPR